MTHKAVAYKRLVQRSGVEPHKTGGKIDEMIPDCVLLYLYIGV